MMISLSQPQYLLATDGGEELIVIMQQLSTLFCVFLIAKIMDSLDTRFLQLIHKLLLLLEDVLQLS